MTDTLIATPQRAGSQLAAPIADAVTEAVGRIAPVWPLDRFVAVNPYFGLADRGVGDAAALLAAACGARTTLPVDEYARAIGAGTIRDDDVAAALVQHGLEPTLGTAELMVRAARADDGAGLQRTPTVASSAAAVLDEDWAGVMVDRIGAWAAAYFDAGAATWRSAADDLGPFAAWRFEATIDRTPEILGLRGFRRAARAYPADPEQALERAVDVIGVPEAGRADYFHALLLRVGGWAAHAARVRFEARRHGSDDTALAELLTIAVVWEALLLECAPDPAVHEHWTRQCATTHASPRPVITDALRYRLVLHDALEHAHQRQIIAAIHGRSARPGGADRPRAQAVFCIDVRSEVMRRHLETVAPDVATIGFAGFFAMPLELVALGHDSGVAQCPVLLEPAFTVHETLRDGDASRAVAIRHRGHAVKRAWKSFKNGAVSCFSFVGPVGLAYLPKLYTDGAGRTRPVAPPESEGLPAAMDRARRPDVSTLALDQQIALAAGALTAMSMTDRFAPLVLIVGHGATSVNNPYEQALSCGACGGHSGEVNARVTALLLNDPSVRAGLAERGIVVPDDTWFVAAGHDTTTDEITLFDRDDVPAAWAEAIVAIEGELASAGHLTRLERAGRLGIDASDEGEVDRAVARRALDWAQVRPEWGLAGCRAFIAAPRENTRDVDLGGRAFLHSYDWRQDAGFGVLELIMTAPVVVASWINLQYFGSTVDNAVFGSGNKTLHNVVGRLGVLEGNGGDLRVGLPWQSVHDGTRLQHDPVRLSVVVAAPTAALDDVLARHEHVRHLCDNGWVHLFAMDDTGNVAQRYVGAGRWSPVAS